MRNLCRDLIDAVHRASSPVRTYRPPIVENLTPYKVLTPTNVKQKIEAISEGLSASAAYAYMDTEAIQDKDRNNDACDDEEESGSVTVGDDISTAGGNASSGKRKAEKTSLKDQILQSYPKIATTDIILIIKNDELEVIYLSCAAYGLIHHFICVL